MKSGACMASITQHALITLRLRSTVTRKENGAYLLNYETKDPKDLIMLITSLGYDWHIISLLFKVPESKIKSFYLLKTKQNPTFSWMLFKKQNKTKKNPSYLMSLPSWFCKCCQTETERLSLSSFFQDILRDNNSHWSLSIP